jgi:hypothetical protein
LFQKEILKITAGSSTNAWHIFGDFQEETGTFAGLDHMDEDDEQEEFGENHGEGRLGGLSHTDLAVIMMSDLNTKTIFSIFAVFGVKWARIDG